MNLKDCQLQFPELIPVDHVRRCPRFTNVFNRNHDDGIQIEELDDLQLEMEDLLASSTQRMRKLKVELRTVSDLQDNKKDKKIPKGKESDLKRSRVMDEKPPKKMKLQAEIMKPLQAVVSTPSPSSNRSKAKGNTPRHSEPEILDDIPTKPRGPETPNKFWQMVDTYCGEIPASTIKFLEKLSKPVNKNDDIFKIPELGPHFSQQWSLEDLGKDKAEGQCVDNKISTDDIETQKMLKKSYENMQNAEACPFGSLTQRLISSFVEENIMAPPGTGPTLDEARFDMAGLSSSSDANSSPKSNKPFSVPYTPKLESRIKLELMDQGILEHDSKEQDDEILTEIKRCQQELYALSERNRSVSSQLLKLAKTEIKKQELKKKIEKVNQEIIEHHRRVAAARQKKRPLMRKEKDIILKSIKERETLVKQLDQMQATS